MTGGDGCAKGRYLAGGEESLCVTLFCEHIFAIGPFVALPIWPRDMSTMAGEWPRGYAAPPLLSTGFAVGACTLFTASYVGGLYVSPTTRIGSTKAKDEKGNPLDRNHPKVIKARMVVASLSTVVSLVSTGVVLTRLEQPSTWWVVRALTACRRMGLPLPMPSFLTSNSLPFHPPISHFCAWLVKQVVLPLSLTSALFAGPLYVAYLHRTLPFQDHFDVCGHARDKVGTLSGLRNFVVGPGTEELVFRGCILPLLWCAGWSKPQLIFASPLFFGVAHVHHAYAVYVQGGRTRSALHRGLLTSLVQFVYTGVFGWYADFLFLRTASVIAPFTAHVFCNIMGLPDPWHASHIFPKRKTGMSLAHAHTHTHRVRITNTDIMSLR